MTVLIYLAHLPQRVFHRFELCLNQEDALYFGACETLGLN
jgi:hypothetical protein